MCQYTDLATREEVGMLTNAKTKTVDAKWQEGQATNLAGLLFHEQQIVKISAVIPTLNEEKNLIHVLPNIQQWADEVLLVDGHSSDETVKVARELCPTIRVVMEEDRGKGAALC